MTVSVLRREIREFRGSAVCLPVLVPGDVRHVKVAKAEILYQLEDYDGGDQSPWNTTVKTDQEMFLDVNNSCS